MKLRDPLAINNNNNNNYYYYYYDCPEPSLSPQPSEVLKNTLLICSLFTVAMGVEDGCLGWVH